MGLFFALACQPPDPLDQEEALLNPQDEAERYAHKIVALASLAPLDQSPFNNLDVRINQETGSNVAVSFCDFTQEQRQIFLQAWKEHTAKSSSVSLKKNCLICLPKPRPLPKLFSLIPPATDHLLQTLTSLKKAINNQ